MTYTYVQGAPAGYYDRYKDCGCSGPRNALPRGIGGPGGPGFPGGPGHFPGPFPGPFPIPFPIPIPIPIGPGPGPFPFPQYPFVRVIINGGNFFPRATTAFLIRHFPGMSIGQTLAASGVVRFSPNGRIVFVNGVAIGGPVNVIVRLNGRPIPQTLLTFPVQSGDTVELELIVTGPRVDEFSSHPLASRVENNFDELQRLEAENQ